MEAPGARGVSGTGVGAEGVGGEPVDGDEVHANRAQEVVLVGREALRRDALLDVHTDLRAVLHRLPVACPTSR